LDAALAIIDEERKKQHIMLANDLSKILSNGKSTAGSPMRPGFDPIPKDADRNTPLVDIRHPDRYLQELVLEDHILAALHEVVREFTQWDVLEANGLAPSSKLLFCGPPGCGKTVTAEALAAELGLPLLYVRFDSVVSSLLGETSANLRKVFDYAANGTWVVLFDEFDAIGRSRDDETEHGELKRVVNSFLQLLDQFHGKSIIIAATNFEQSLDPALWRRFDEIARFSRPSVEQIVSLIRLRLGRRTPAGPIVRELSERLAGNTHAEVERVCTDSLKRMVLEGTSTVTPVDIEIALMRHAQRKQALAQATSQLRLTVDER
jgi:SpoVK/Ycf46/Vps4 family AAA+-type ATPase